MIKLAEQKACTGCMSCYNSCAQGAIEIKENDEGFLYPRINVEKCVECGLCIKRCPELNARATIHQSPKVYAIINNKDKKVSSSGGAFSLIARWILEQRGVVFGASMNDNLEVMHIAVESVEDLYKLRGSKYVQSNIGKTFRAAKEFLKKGRKVLFTGTGCQISGLYSFLNGNKYEGQLYTIDLICHGVPSPGTFRAYLKKLIKSSRLKGENRNIEGFGFRKLDSWAYLPTVKFARSKEQILELADNAYMSAFFKGLLFRESCYTCSYCNVNRLGTMTIADFWGIGKHGKPFGKPVASGVSLLIDNCGEFERNIPQFRDAYIEERDLEEALYEQDNLKAPMKRLEYRDNAVKDLIDPNVTLTEFCKKANIAYQPTFRRRLASFVKRTLFKTGLYNTFLNITYKLK